ncbi:hypothetical protein QVD17_06247 [Tagetes erecta]|uniref:GATA-type domain-containing protein n=1 Tax=Tagetes erecta TaxID=13708 RepID=A0AAD8LDE7_TARER|nr:hypothetical protein QVD17_06247 [Tagetes erecta]
MEEEYAAAVNMRKNEKLCLDCNTSKTPLWRTGPAGPKSLCNACGIRFRKKKTSGSGSEKKLSPDSCTSEETTVSSRKREMEVEVDLRMRVVKEMAVLQRPRSPMKKVKRGDKFGEVEQAAYLLMCLSCG